MRKNIYAGLSIIAVTFIIVFFWQKKISNYSIPDFSVKTINGGVLEKQDISGFRTYILYCYQLNSLNKMIINNLIKLTDKENEKIIVLFKEGKYSEFKSNNLVLIKYLDAEETKKRFKLNDTNQGEIIVYNKGGLREYDYNFDDRSNISNFLNRIKRANRSQGNIAHIKSYLENNFQTMPDGVFFIAHHICTPCYSSQAFFYIKEKTLQYKIPYELILTGFPTNIEIYNFKNENSLSKVRAAENALEELVANWSKETQRIDFTFLVVKKAGIVKTFPILSQEDLITLENQEKALLSLFSDRP